MTSTKTRKCKTTSRGYSWWQDDIPQLAAKHYRRNRYQPLTLPAAYDAARALEPGLTLGEFHDGLRHLRDCDLIRLIPFTRALATIPDARNALYLDGEVMYYIEPA